MFDISASVTSFQKTLERSLMWITIPWRYNEHVVCYAAKYLYLNFSLFHKHRRAKLRFISFALKCLFVFTFAFAFYKLLRFDGWYCVFVFVCTLTQWLTQCVYTVFRLNKTKNGEMCDFFSYPYKHIQASTMCWMRLLILIKTECSTSSQLTTDDICYFVCGVYSYESRLTKWK